MGRWIKIGLYSIGGLLGLLVLLVVVSYIVLSQMDFSKYKQKIADNISQRLGQEVTINGDFRVDFSLTPEVEISDVQIANSEGGKAPQLLKIGTLQAKMSLLPLLSGKIVVNHFILKNSQLSIERRDDKFNFATKARKHDEYQSQRFYKFDGDSGYDGFVPIIQQAQISNVAIGFVDHDSGDEHHLQIEAIDIETGQDGKSIDASAKALINETALNITKSLRHTADGKFSVSAEGFLGNLQWEINGSSGALYEFKDTELQLLAKAADFSFAKAFGGRTDLHGGVDIDIKASGNKRDWDLDVRQVVISDWLFNGQATVRRDKRSFKGSLSAASLPVSWLGRDATPAQAQSQRVEASKDKRLFPDSRIFSPRNLGRTDADLKINIADIIDDDNKSLGGFVADIIINEDGVLIDNLRQGKGLSGKISLYKNNQLNADLQLQHFESGIIAGFTGLGSAFSGRVDGQVKLQSNGETWHEMAQNLSGKIELSADKISLHPFAQIPEIFDILGSSGCLLVAAPISKGVANINSAVIVTHQGSLNSHGSINLGDETLSVATDIMLSPLVGLDLDTRLELKGKLANPRLSVNKSVGTSSLNIDLKQLPQLLAPDTSPITLQTCRDFVAR